LLMHKYVFVNEAGVPAQLPWRREIHICELWFFWAALGIH